MTSFDNMSGKPSKRGKMEHPGRFLEYSVNTEEAVNFYQDCDPCEGENKEVVKRLRAKVAAVMTDSSTSQEETEELDKRKGVKKAVTDVSQTDVERCDDHPEEMAEYWCEEDCKVVCKDCLIFGEHRGHSAVKGDKRRLAIMVDKVAKILPSLERELGRAQEIGKIVAVEGKELLNKSKEEIIKLLDAKYEVESKRMFSLLSDHYSSLLKTITTIHSSQAGLLSSQSPLDPEEVAMLISHPLQLYMTPGTEAWDDTVLSITPPVMKVTSDPNPCSSSLTTTQASHLLDRSPVDDRRCEKIISIDIMTVDGDIVKAMENGTPGQFYCRLVSTDTEMEDMEKMLLDVEEEEVYPSPGQGVLVRLNVRWFRATLLDCDDKGWRCELVDNGQVVEGVKEVDMSNLPLSVLEIPAMTVRCSLAGCEDTYSWTKEAKINWEKIIHEQQFKMIVVDPALNVVHLTRQNVSLVDSLVFLGHVPEVTPITLPTQQFSPPGPLSSSATLCCDYKQISPNSLLLYFDNPLHVAHLEQLSQLHHHPALVSPPGHVQPGSAVLAPWEGGLFRAAVLAVTGTSLTVLYVDHGNTDMVSWWDCCAVPRDLLFPPLATQVRMGGLRPVGEGGWSGEGRERFHQVLNDSEGTLVKIIKSEAGQEPEVRLMVRSGQDLEDVGDLLVKEGFAQWEEKEKNVDKYQVQQTSHDEGVSQRSSNSSSGTMMSNFLGVEDSTDLIDKKLVTEVDSASSMHVLSVLKRKIIVKNAGVTEHRIMAPLHRQPSSNVFPLLPTKQVFTAMLMHIDSSGVVWVFPETVMNLFSEIIAELGSCVDPVQNVSPGVMVVARISGRKVRGRVLEEGSVVKLVDIDSGEAFSSPKENLMEVSPSLLCKPPLAIPLKLYGVRKSCTALDDYETDAVFDKIGKKTSTPFWCNVSVLEKNLDQFPLPAYVRYTVLEEHDGNLALDLVEMGLCDVITSFSQWEREVSDHCLDWMLDTMSVPNTLSFMPHPLPLAVGQWLHVSVEGLEYPLDEEGLEKEPDITTPDANRIGVQVKHLSNKSAFDQHQEDIAQSLAVVAPQVLKLNKLAMEARISLTLSARTAEKVASPTVGQSVLVFYEFFDEGEGGEWCRGTVETIQRGGRVTIHYTDYGHRGQVKVGQLRSMRYKDRMMPVQLREVKFLLPDSNQELGAIRLDLRQEEKMMMRVESITPLGHPMELEEILVSVWRAVDGEEEDTFLLSKIC